MSRWWIWSLIVVALATTSVESMSPKLAEKWLSTRRDKVRLPIDWSRDPLRVERVDLADIRYQTQEIKDAVTRWDEVLQGMGDDKGFLQPWYRRYHDRDTLILWRTTAPSFVNQYGAWDRNGETVPGNNYFASIECNPQTNQPMVTGAVLDVRWISTDDWSVRFDYAVGSGTGCNPYLWFHRKATAQHPAITYSLLQDSGCWFHTTTFDGVDYEFSMIAPAVDWQISKDLPKAQLARFQSATESAEGLRDTGLSMLHELQQAVEAGVLSGVAIRSVKKLIRTEGGTHGGDPPRHIYEHPNRPLTEAELKSVLDTARAELTRRRQILEQHHEGMYSAIAKGVPIRKLLGP